MTEGGEEREVVKVIEECEGKGLVGSSLGFELRRDRNGGVWSEVTRKQFDQGQAGQAGPAEQANVRA